MGRWVVCSMTSMIDIVDEYRGVKAVADMVNNKGLTIMHWNARSMYPKYEEILHLCENSDCELLCISESWLTDIITDDMISIPGYNLFRKDRDEASGKQREGGVCVYVKNKLLVSVCDNMTICTPHIEVLTIKLKLVRTRDIYLSIVYLPPDGDVKEFVNAVENLHGRMLTQRAFEFNMVGDININWSAQTPANKLYKDLCK